MQQQVPYFQQGGAQYMSPAPIIYSAPIPAGPPTIVIDTSPQAMVGFQDDLQQAVRGVPVMGQSGGRRTTPRARDGSPRRAPATVSGSQVSPTAKITIQKLG